MTRQFILASNNPKKLHELRQILVGLDVEVISQREAGCDFEVDETGETFEENAWLKAAAVTRATGKPAIADDSGLVVDALGGEPGVHSARYGGSHGTTDEYKYRLLLKNMEEQEQRGARFVSCIVCTFPDGEVIRTCGECEGEILLAPDGDGGFGYDPIFRPSGADKSMAQITSEEKNEISHRGIALRGFMEILKQRGY